ncbi:hypothetical protein LguiA_013075 [Lonicera macranthoides]
MDSRAEVCSSRSKKNEGAKNQRTIRPHFIEEGERDDINKQVEDFIKSFRNQLKIQPSFDQTLYNVGGTNADANSNDCSPSTSICLTMPSAPKLNFVQELPQNSDDFCPFLRDYPSNTRFWLPIFSKPRWENCRKNGMKNEGAKKQRAVRSRFIEEGERSDINKQAEDFIKKFRNELKIQREESLKRFKEMLDRGT